MSEWSFYDPATGLFADRVWGEDAHVAVNTPAGMVAMRGRFDHLSQRVQLVTDDHGEQVPIVIDYIPDKPEDTESTTWRWSEDSKRWVASTTLAALKRAAGNSVDAFAGAARLRYVTEVPGQQGVYLRKAEQATAFIAAGGVGDVPPYIAAEANATGLTPLLAAQRIAAIAQQWDDVVGPAIEFARIGGKAAVEAAEDPDAVAAALEAARAALQAI